MKDFYLLNELNPLEVKGGVTANATPSVFLLVGN